MYLGICYLPLPVDSVQIHVWELRPEITVLTSTVCEHLLSPDSWLKRVIIQKQNKMVHSHFRRTMYE